MFDLNLQQMVLILGAGLFTAVAAISDLRTRRIPNKLTVPVFALGLIYQVSFSGWSGLGEGLLGFAVGFGTLFVLWMIGGGGGGDVKLMGALGAWMGFQNTLYVLVLSTVFVVLGTMLTMVFSVIKKGFRRTKNKYLATGKQKKGKKFVKETQKQKEGRRIMAFAVPVAVATWLVMIWKVPEVGKPNIQQPVQQQEQTK